MSTPKSAVTGRSAWDMARSLLVLLVPIALLVAFVSFTQQGGQATVSDPEPVIAQARAAGHFPVTVPHDLGDGWRPVSAGFATAGDGATLRIGYLTPRGEGVQFVVSDVPADKLLAAELGDRARPRGAESVAERRWQRFDARLGETALVLPETGRTVIVIGAAAVEDLRALAAAIG